MARMGKIVRRIAGLIAAGWLLTACAAAEIPYKSYNYLSDFTVVETPHAYVPEKVAQISGRGISGLDAPLDLFVDADENVYVADTGNDRILCMDADFRVTRVMERYLCDGREVPYSEPSGLWVGEDGLVYVADSGNGRVVAVNEKDEALRVLGRPDTDLIDDELVFRPTGVTADKYGRVMVIAKGVNLGVIVYNASDAFQGFLGAQKVSYSVLDYMWKRFMSEEQKSRMQAFVPTEYSSLTSDGSGFLYVVASSLNTDDLEQTILTRNTDGRTAPVRLLNHSGFDILPRNGYFPPVGDVVYERKNNIPLLSAFRDIALGPAETYTVLDTQKGRIFTYSQNGDLLFVFGNKSAQLGNMVGPCAISYQGSRLLVLDSVTADITVFSRTQYGDLLIKAQEQFNAYDYAAAAKEWNAILEWNPNYDLAYDGIGASLLQTGRSREAMEYFKKTDNNKLYSEAFAEYRGELVRRYLPFILLAAAAIIAALILFFRFVGRCNRRPAEQRKHSFWQEIAYGFYVMFHPLDGFWDLKHEKRGSVRAAGVIMAAVFLSDVLRRIMTARLFNGSRSEDLDLIQMLMNTAGIALLFILANWCLTSLMDGKGNMRDIFVSTGYALLPMALLKFAAIPLSYLFTLEEGMYLGFVNGLGLIWGVGLVFVGIMVTQQYSLLKNTATCALSVVGMGVILFIALLYLTTVSQIFEFIRVLFIEMSR